MTTTTKNKRVQGAGALVIRTARPLDYYMRSFAWTNPETYPVILEPGLAVLNTPAPLNAALGVGNQGSIIGFIFQRTEVAVGEKVNVPYITGILPQSGSNPLVGCVLNQESASQGTYQWTSDAGTFLACARSAADGNGYNNTWRTVAVNLGFTVVQPNITTLFTEQATLATPTAEEESEHGSPEKKSNVKVK